MGKKVRVLESLFSRFRRREHERKLAAVDDIRQAIITLTQSEDGDGEAELDLDHYAALFEREGLTENDVRAAMQIYRERIAKYEIAAEAEGRRNAATVAEQKFLAAGEEEGRRRQAAMLELERLEENMRTELLRSNAAEAALADLQAGSSNSIAWQRLNAQLTDLNQRIDRLRALLDENPRWGDKPAPANVWSNIGEAPAHLARQTREALATFKSSQLKVIDKASPRDPRLEQLNEQLACAENAVNAAKRELAALEKERERFAAQFDQLQDERLAPENFILPKGSKSRDELAKQQAARIGLAPNFEGVSLIRG